MLAHLKKFDWLLVAAALLLVSFGLISIYGSAGLETVNFKKQILWLAVGFFVMVALSFFDYRVFKNFKTPIIILYTLSLLLLLGVLIFGVSVGGSESWYRIGPVSFEPVEFTKIVIILLLAKYFSMRHIEIYRARHIIVSGMYVFIPALFLFLQPELGSVIIMASVWLGVMLIAGIKAKQILALLAIGITALLVAWVLVLADYQKERIISFVNPESDPRGAGYNVQQSLIAVGSGGILGKGVGQGTQARLGFLPEPQTDFIYPAIVEEMGLVGGLVVLVCVLLLIRRVMNISRFAANNFARLVAAGFSVMIVSQVVVNTGMTLGLFPITGIPLPFVSYGGSSMISLFAMLGILQSIKVNA